MMERVMGVDADVGSTFINMGLSLQEEFPGEDNFITLLEDAPFFEILFISKVSSFADKITKKALSRFKAYDALTTKILKFKEINSFNGPVSDYDAMRTAEHMVDVDPQGIGIFYSEEYQFLCLVRPKCSENHHSSEEVN